jgi:streptogramin lyase
MAAAVAAIAAVSVGLALALRDGSSVAVLPDSIVEIDAATNKVVDSTVVGGEPGQVRVLAGGVFVTSVKNTTLTRIDARTGDVTTSGEHAAGRGVAADGDQLWVGSESRAEVTRVNPRSLSAIERIRLTDRLPGELLHALPALGAGSLWVSEVAPSAVTRWSLRTHRLIRRYELAPLEFPVEITFGDGAAWVPLFESDELLRIDAVTGATRRISVGPGPTNPVLGFGSLWVTSTGQGTVWRINALSERVERVIDVGTVAFGVAIGGGSVWVGDYCDGAIARIDPRTNTVLARVQTGPYPRWLAFGAGHLWVGVGSDDTFEFPGCTQ